MIKAESIVIVGAGLAGGNAALTLRSEGFRNRLVLIGNEPALPYGRPLLSKTYLRGEEDLGDWYVKPAEWYAQNEVELRTSTSVQHIDFAQRQVVLDSDEKINAFLASERAQTILLVVPDDARRQGVTRWLKTCHGWDGNRTARIQIPGALALVTGAGSGIGRATALALADGGASVLCVDIDVVAAEKTAAACGEGGAPTKIEALRI